MTQNDGPQQVAGPNESGVKVGGVFYPLDLSRLDWEEAGEISRITGMGMVAFGTELESDDPDARVMLAMLWLALHRSNPRETVETVGQLDIDQVEFVFPPPSEDDSRPPAAASPVSSPTLPAPAESGETNGQPSLELGGVPGSGG